MKKLTVFSLIALASSLFANEVKYASSVKNLYETSDSTSSKGRLLPTSKLTVLEKVGDKIKVEIEGFAKEGVNQAVYFVEGKRILVAGLSKSSKFDLKTISSSKDDSGKTWNKVKFIAYTKDENLVKDLDTLYKTAQTTFAENCAMCHPAHPAHEFTANQWPSIVKSMVNRTAMTKEQNYLVTQYLQKHAKDMEKEH